MSSLVETLARKHLSQDLDKLSIHKLTGGISSEIYKVYDPDDHDGILLPVAITIVRDPNSWWKIEKERLIRGLLYDDPEVLLPKIIDLGVDVVDGNKVAFMISQFIKGEDLDTFLERKLSQYTGTDKLSFLVSDLGFRIGALHRHQAGIYGLIGLTLDQYNNWQEYILAEFDREIRLISELDSDIQIGSAKVDLLKVSLRSIERLIGELQSSLIVPESKVSHGDARFGNFMADTNPEGDWVITSMVDLEAMLGGDPEIDIAFMENWLHFSSYKGEFFNRREVYREGYQKMRSPSVKYQEKRFIYHALRSLTYLRTVFGFDIEEFICSDSRYQRYAEQHMEIVQSLAHGNYLEDIGILSLI